VGAPPRRSLLISGVAPVWVLTIAFAGREWRWGTQPCSFSWALPGKTIAVGGGLPPIEIGHPFSLFSSSPEPRSLPFELRWPEDVAELIEAGHDLGSATGELALAWTSEDWSQRVKVLTGNIVGVEYGADDEPVKFNLETSPADDAALVPSEKERVDSVTWPNAYTGHKGRYYPQVFGAPGVYDTGVGSATTATTQATDALIVVRSGTTAEKLLVCGGKVAATQVWIWDSGGTPESFTITHETDGRGRLVAVVDISGASSISLTSTSFRAGWGFGGGLLNRQGTGAISTWGEIAQWLLERTTLATDYGRTAAALKAPELQSVVLGGVLDDAVSPYAVLQDDLLPLAPVSITAGSEGLFPVVWQPDAEPIDHLEAGPGVVRVDRVRYIRSSREVINKIRVDYAISADTSEPKLQLAISGQADDGEIYGSPYALDSQTRYGVRDESLESRWIWRRSTALKVGQTRLRRSAFLERGVMYRVGIDRAWLERGQMITLTDDELHLNERPCLVADVILALPWVLLDLVIVEDYLRR
jgi:hypothetical protein